MDNSERPEAAIIGPWHRSPFPVKQTKPLREISGLSNAFRSTYRQFEPLEDSSRAALGMALGWGIRICRTAEAVVALHRLRFDSEASPLVRSVMEHALKLRWLVTEQKQRLRRSSTPTGGTNAS